MEKIQQLSAKLSQADLEKCGVGTENACFALGSSGPDGIQCLLAKTMQGDENAGQIMGYAGIQLGWRVNVDKTDGKAWCPKGVLENSKA